MTDKYRWNTPHDWVLWQMDRHGAVWAADALRVVILKVDADTLQDIFEKEMDADGYFDAEEEN